jgi:alkylation response protein AidB-like acyl-CoA dehydrogenase
VTIKETPSDDAFRTQARAAVAGAAAAAGWVPSPALGSGDGHERLRRKRMEQLLAEQGWAGIAWPADYGGRGESLRRQAIFAEELSALGLATPYNRVAMGIVGPALIQHGTEEQKRRYLPSMLSCEQIWCQGFSEPDAGSDLASLRTSARASATGEHWIINGQKVWTTLGADADFCFLLARTGDGPKHHAISVLLVPMDQPGVQVRPIKQINGEQDFCEVWFQDAVTRIDQVVGAVNEGWAVTMSALSYERSLHLLQRQLRYRKLVRELECATDWAAAGEAAQDALVDVEIAGLALAFAMDDQLAALEGGSAGGGGLSAVDANTSKVYWSESYRRLSELGADLALAGATGSSREWTQEYYSSLATTIYAGTNEIQRNIIAERGLGLPR